MAYQLLLQLWFFSRQRKTAALTAALTAILSRKDGIWADCGKYLPPDFSVGGYGMADEDFSPVKQPDGGKASISSL
jgi:hypothetical protein